LFTIVTISKLLLKILDERYFLLKISISHNNTFSLLGRFEFNNRFVLHIKTTIANLGRKHNFKKLEFLVR